MALFEAAKGFAAVLGMLGLLSLLHHDMHRLALELIGHFGWSPEAHYPGLLISTVDRLHDTPIQTVVLAGSGYAAIRWIEAWGLWHDKAWGEWLGALSSGIYIPLEVRHILHSPHWQGVAVMVLNVVLMLVLFWRIAQRRRDKHALPASTT